jgi:hypothetical protein
MKKIVQVLAVLMFTAPALAGVLITCDKAGNSVTVGYDASGMDQLPRAFALDITVDGGTIVPGSVGDLSDDFYIYPGSIVINPDGTVQDFGSPVASQVDYPDGTLGGPGTSGMTIEMGSLYAAEDPTHKNPPPPAGDLLSFDVTGGTVTIAENVRRGGVVMEDLSPADPEFAACEEEGCPCLGDLDGNSQIDLQDLSALADMLVAAGPPFVIPVGAGHCGDFESNLQVDLQDLSALVDILVAAGPPFIVPCQ